MVAAMRTLNLDRFGDEYYGPNWITLFVYVQDKQEALAIAKWAGWHMDGVRGDDSPFGFAVLPEAKETRKRLDVLTRHHSNAWYGEVG